MLLLTSGTDLNPATQAQLATSLNTTLKNVENALSSAVSSVISSTSTLLTQLSESDIEALAASLTSVTALVNDLQSIVGTIESLFVSATKSSVIPQLKATEAAVQPLIAALLGYSSSITARPGASTTILTNLGVTITGLLNDVKYLLNGLGLGHLSSGLEIIL